MINIKTIKAEYGDCLLVTISYEEKNFNILVDGGTKNTYIKKNKKKHFKDGPLKHLIQCYQYENKSIDLLILTHVDDDHIGGLNLWFNNDFPSSEFVHRFWFNDNEQITVETGNSRLNTISEAIELKELLAKNKFYFDNKLIAGNSYDFEWGKIFILAPSVEGLKSIIKKWDNKLLENSPRIPISYKKTINELIKEDYTTTECSPENNASIAMLIETKDFDKALLLGDADIDVVCKSLIALGYSEKNPVKCRYVKLAHHGSKNNFSMDFLKLVNAENFIISTNGSHFGHPDKEVIARLVKYTSSNICFNYIERIDQLFMDKDYTDYPNLKSRIINAG